MKNSSISFLYFIVNDSCWATAGAERSDKRQNVIFKNYDEEKKETNRRFPFLDARNTKVIFTTFHSHLMILFAFWQHWSFVCWTKKKKEKKRRNKKQFIKPEKRKFEARHLWYVLFPDIYDRGCLCSIIHKKGL